MVTRRPINHQGVLNRGRQGFVPAWWAYWLIFGLVMGFAAGGSVVAHYYEPVEQAYDAGGDEGGDKPDDGPDAPITFWERTSGDPVAPLAFWQVILSAVLAVSTVGLLYANLCAARSSNKMADAARRTYHADHRSRLRVHQVALPLRAGKPLCGNLILVNEGGSTAQIGKAERWKRTQLRVHWTETTLPQEHIFREMNKDDFCVLDHPTGEIKPGQVVLWKFSSAPRSLTEEQLGRVRRGDLYLYVIGIIRYSTEATGNQVPHHTLFCRRFCPEADRYEPVDDDYYEYHS